MKTVRVAISGVGNVGARIAEAIEQRSVEFVEDWGVDVRISGVCASNGGRVDPDGIPADEVRRRVAFDAELTGTRFIDDVTADVLIEAGPSDYQIGEPGLGYLTAALARDMHVICVSKGALVVAGEEIYRQAAAAGRQIRVSGAAASAMPSVDFLTYDLAGAGVRRVEALLTGTTTYVLDCMHRHGLDLSTAVAQAQERGIAEPKPEFDIEGWDTAAKLVVIARAAFGVDVRIDDIPRQSISAIENDEWERWRRDERTPRLVGILEREENNGVRASVEIRAYPAAHSFSLTEGSMKALFVSTDRMGEYSLLGGASSPDATAAAAIKDLAHILVG